MLVSSRALKFWEKEEIWRFFTLGHENEENGGGIDHLSRNCVITTCRNNRINFCNIESVMSLKINHCVSPVQALVVMQKLFKSINYSKLIRLPTIYTYVIRSGFFVCPYNKLSSALKTSYNILLILGQYRGGDYGAIIRVMVSVLLDVTQYLYTYLKSIKRPSHHQYYYKSYSKLAECVCDCACDLHVYA
jgi:hypothetical protein